MDNLTIQYVIVGILVLVAVWYVARNIRRSLKGKSSCSKGCDCSCGTVEKAQKAN